jgi:hypothetical protein
MQSDKEVRWMSVYLPQGRDTGDLNMSRQMIHVGISRAGKNFESRQERLS